MLRVRVCRESRVRSSSVLISTGLAAASSRISWLPPSALPSRRSRTQVLRPSRRSFHTARDPPHTVMSVAPTPYLAATARRMATKATVSPAEPEDTAPVGPADDGQVGDWALEEDAAEDDALLADTYEEDDAPAIQEDAADKPAFTPTVYTARDGRAALEKAAGITKRDHMEQFFREQSLPFDEERLIMMLERWENKDEGEPVYGPVPDVAEKLMQSPNGPTPVTLRPPLSRAWKNLFEFMLALHQEDIPDGVDFVPPPASLTEEERRNRSREAELRAAVKAAVPGNLTPLANLYAQSLRALVRSERYSRRLSDAFNMTRHEIELFADDVQKVAEMDDAQHELGKSLHDNPTLRTLLEETTPDEEREPVANDGYEPDANVFNGLLERLERLRSSEMVVTRLRPHRTEFSMNFRGEADPVLPFVAKEEVEQKYTGDVDDSTMGLNVDVDEGGQDDDEDDAPDIDHVQEVDVEAKMAEMEDMGDQHPLSDLARDPMEELGLPADYDIMHLDYSLWGEVADEDRKVEDHLPSVQPEDETDEIEEEDTDKLDNDMEEMWQVETPSNISEQLADILKEDKKRKKLPQPDPTLSMFADAALETPLDATDATEAVDTVASLQSEARQVASQQKSEEATQGSSTQSSNSGATAAKEPSQRERTRRGDPETVSIMEDVLSKFPTPESVVKALDEQEELESGPTLSSREVEQTALVHSRAMIEEADDGDERPVDEEMIPTLASSRFTSPIPAWAHSFLPERQQPERAADYSHETEFPDETSYLLPVNRKPQIDDHSRRKLHEYITGEDQEEGEGPLGLEPDDMMFMTAVDPVVVPQMTMDTIYNLYLLDPVRWNMRVLSATFGYRIERIRAIVLSSQMERDKEVRGDLAPFDPAAEHPDLPAISWDPDVPMSPFGYARETIVPEHVAENMKRDDMAHWSRKAARRPPKRNPTLPRMDGSPIPNSQKQRTNHKKILFTDISGKGENINVAVRETDGSFRRATDAEFVKAVQIENPYYADRARSIPRESEAWQQTAMNNIVKRRTLIRQRKDVLTTAHA